MSPPKHVSSLTRSACRSPQRRRFLRHSALGGAALLLAPSQSLLSATSEPLHLEELENGVCLLRTSYANVLALHNDAGLLLVDGVNGEDTPALLQSLGEWAGGSAVQLLYNTHWHWDRTGSNETLRAAGARIIAHENTRLWLTHDFYVDWEARHYRPRPASALPTETFYEEHLLEFADETLESGLLFQAHTDGDIYVKLRERNILVTGDIVINGGFPVPDPVTGGWIGALTAAQARLLELADDDSRIIPGRGAMMRRADLQAYHERVVELRERIYALVRLGKSPREMLAEGVAAGFESWGDPSLFIMNVYPGLGRHYREVDGVV